MSISMFTADRISFNTRALYRVNSKDHYLVSSQNDKKGTGAKAFLQRNVTCRGGYAAALILSPFSSSADFLLGILSTIGSFLTLTLYKPLNVRANLLRANGCAILARSFSNLILTINPGASIAPTGETTKGIIHKKFALRLFNQGIEWSQTEKSMLQKHVFSRIAFFGCALLSLVTRTADFVIGLFCAAASLLTLGTFARINHLAISGLTGLYLFNDLFSGLTLAINPWAFLIEPPPMNAQERRERDALLQSNVV